jgi:ribonuclease J
LDPKPKAGRTSIVPLGGLGEVGLNCLLLEADGDAVLVDCGSVFPGSGHPGADFLIPDFAWLRENGVGVRAVFLTHGHEDHVGAVPHFLACFAVPVYGTPLTLGLLERRLRERLPSARKLLRPVRCGEHVEAGAFRAEFLAVTHSIPQACALGLDTPGGTLVHTGDFKFDAEPVDGKFADEEGLRRWGARGVDLLCCDSTNAATVGRTAPERQVGAVLRRLVHRVEGRVYVATFASNIHRLQQIIEASREASRSVAFLGRSLAGAVQVARRLGCIWPAPGDIVPECRARSLLRERVTLVVTGSQGEEGSALFRIAQRIHPEYRIARGDAVFFCSRAIPGNESAIYGLVNLCLRQGAEVHYEEVSEVHVSGHGAADDVRRMLELTLPRHVLPVHGELRHLDAMARLAETFGVPRQRVFRIENGHSLRLQAGRVELGPSRKAGRLCLEREVLCPSEDEVFSDRRRLGREGLAVAVVTLPVGSESPGVQVFLRGLFPAAEANGRAREAEFAVRRRLAGFPVASSADASTLRAETSAALRRHFQSSSGRRPLCLAVLAPASGGEAGGRSEGLAEVDSGEEAPLK